MKTVPCAPRECRLTILGIPGGHDSRAQASFLYKHGTNLMISGCGRQRRLARQGGGDSRFSVFQGGTTHAPKPAFFKNILQIL